MQYIPCAIMFSAILLSSTASYGEERTQGSYDYRYDYRSDARALNPIGPREMQRRESSSSRMHIGSNPYVGNSTANPYGAGNPYRGDGINNPYGRGNSYRPSSGKNPYAAQSDIRIGDRD
jgi:hypothetical protein